MPYEGVLLIVHHVVPAVISITANIGSVACISGLHSQQQEQPDLQSCLHLVLLVPISSLIT